MVASLDELDELIQVMKGKHSVESMIICGYFQVSLPSTEGIIGPCVMGGNVPERTRAACCGNFGETSTACCKYVCVF